MNSSQLLSFAQENLLLVTLAVFSGLGLVFPGFRRTGGGMAVSPTEATMLMNRENAKVLDVRNAEEFAAGRVPDALNIPLDKLGERAGEIAKLKEKPLIVCCATGTRASRACSDLKKQGFTQIYNLSGGIDAWVQAGLPVKKG